MTSSARARIDGGTVRPSALAGLEVDDQFEPGRLLDRRLGGFGSFEDLVDKGSGALEILSKPGP